MPMQIDDGTSTDVVLLPLLMGGRRPGARQALASIGEHPAHDVVDRRSRSIWSRLRRIFRACSSRVLPALVGATPDLVLTTSGAPASCSSCVTLLLIAEAVMFSTSAACAMLLHSHTATKSCSDVRSNLRDMNGAIILPMHYCIRAAEGGRGLQRSDRDRAPRASSCAYRTVIVKLLLSRKSEQLGPNHLLEPPDW